MIATPTAHLGTVLPHEDGFAWRCLCGRTPTADNVWGDYDMAAAALARHADTVRRAAHYSALAEQARA